MTKGSCCLLGLGCVALAALISGCSLKSAKELYGDGALTIKVVKDKASEIASDFISPFFSFKTHEPSLMSAPTSIDEFNCFAVNVTGPGIISQNQFDPACTFTSENMAGRGIGFISDMVGEGTPIDVMVTTGINRQIDVFAMLNGFCGSQGGSGPPPPPDNPDHYDGSKAFFVGSRITDISGPSSITIPVGFTAGTPHSIFCQQKHILLRHTLENTTAGYGHKAELTANAVGSLAGASVTDVFANNVTSGEIGDYDTSIVQADGGTGGFYPRLVVMLKATGNFDVSKYPSMRIDVEGYAKGNNSSCTTDSGADSAFEIYVFDPSGNWSLSPVATDYFHASAEIDTPPLTSGGYIAVGIQGPTSGSVSCLAVNAVTVNLFAE